MAAPSNDTPQTIVQAFQSLALSEGLSKKSREYKERRRDFIANSVQTGFVAQFGANTGSLQSWNRLCETVLGDISEKDLSSIKKWVLFASNLIMIKSQLTWQALKGIFVNLVDLVDAANAGKTIRRTFTSSKDLSRYIKQTKKIFPKSQAKANPLLRLIVVN